MKVSQEGIEEVKKDPSLVGVIGFWLRAAKFSTCCPITGRMTKADYEECKSFCHRIWPELRQFCPCTEYGIEGVIQIAKQIVGEETTNVK